MNQRLEKSNEKLNPDLQSKQNKLKRSETLEGLWPKSKQVEVEEERAKVAQDLLEVWRTPAGGRALEVIIGVSGVYIPSKSEVSLERDAGRRDVGLFIINQLREAINKED